MSQNLLNTKMMFEYNCPVFEYYIKEGDTLCSISKKFGIDKETIINMNQLTNSDDLHVGDVLLIIRKELIKNGNSNK